MNDELILKPVADLLELNFHIPSYQRGYRWSERQVIDLLEDISEFLSSKKENDFYCLQPIVVKKESNNKAYRVIDGQQRLTTIFLILKLFNEIEFKRPKGTYEISFDTRNIEDNNSYGFLSNMNINSSISNKNLDLYFLSSNYKIIYEWFEKKLTKEEDFIQRLYPVFINDVQIIWYEIGNEDEIDIFTRLNIGKIPLTNGELIKALFLINTKEENEKLLLASQWDEIEYKMQNAEYFSFINSGDYEKPTKIEYIFDLVAKNEFARLKDLELKELKIRKDDSRKSYYIFNALIKNDKSSKKYWDKIKTYFRIFNEFFEDNEYYHLVGYLVHNGVKIEDIIEWFKEKTKDEFMQFLKKKINEITKPKNNKIEDLNYQDNYKEITKILFLFNVISTMDGGFSKYPFNLHKKQKWSLEHIHAQNSEEIKEEDRKTLLDTQREYIADRNLKNEIIKILEEEKINEEEFNKIQDKILAIYSDDIDVHTIGNL